MEHRDRIQQILRLSAEQMIAPPELYPVLIGRGELPPGFGVDIPVLRVVFKQRVFFDTAQDVIRPEGEQVIDLLAEVLRRGAADTSMIVSGHTDNRGSDAYNYFLSVRRAESAAVSLSRRHILRTAIWRVGFGKAVPLVPNTSEENMARNRRVEFIIGRKAEAVARFIVKQRELVCPDASDAERRACFEVFDRLPPVNAVPVIDGRVGPGIGSRPTVQDPPDATREHTALPRVESPALVEPGRPKERVSIGPPGTAPTVVEIPPAERQTVEIRPEEPMLVDLREGRVLVERLER